MGTRLLAEKLIKNKFPQIKHLRVHTSGKGKVTIYAWDDNLEISDSLKNILSIFGTNDILAHVIFEVKPYDQIKSDNIPNIQSPPEVIMNAAYVGGLNKSGILDTIKIVFPELELVYDGFNSESGKINFTVYNSATITNVEEELLEQYLYEIIPLGAMINIQYIE